MAVFPFLLFGCKPDGQAEFPPFDGRRAFAEVEALVKITPRDAGTANARKAAEHIRQRLESFGVAAEIDTFNDKTPDGEQTFHNVVGRIPGKTDKWIILGSHFDTMPGIKNFQGANDGGSSTGVLLELARMLAGQRPRVGIIFAFFDGEEGIADYGPNDGLHGSRHLATTLVETGKVKTIQSMVLLDMVGDKDLHFTIPFNSSRTLVKEVLDAAHAAGHRDRFTLSLGMVITDDHQPFLDAGVPAIDLIDFRFGSAPGLNDYWHTDADNLENIGSQSLETTGNILLKLLEQTALD
ncbi:MAG: M28 family peptidase [Kiritimatiellales bacterium]|nr:M28 family peptidase [Kiritimatiellales bacterium]